MSNEAARHAVLRKVPAFKGLDDAGLGKLTAFLKFRQAGAGEVLFRQGEMGDSMLIVTDGTLGVQLQNPGTLPVDLGSVGPGEVIGEMACVDPGPRAATVTALAATGVYELDRARFTALKEAAPGVWSAVIGAVITDVTRRLREIEAKVDRELGGAPSGSTPPPSDAPKSAPERGGFMRFIDRLRGQG